MTFMFLCLKALLVLEEHCCSNLQKFKVKNFAALETAEGPLTSLLVNYIMRSIFDFFTLCLIVSKLHKGHGPA